MEHNTLCHAQWQLSSCASPSSKSSLYPGKQEQAPARVHIRRHRLGLKQQCRVVPCLVCMCVCVGGGGGGWGGVSTEYIHT